MGASGFMAYRHNGKYYRVFVGDNAYPDECMISFINPILRNSVKLEDWIQKTTQALEDKDQWGSLFSKKDGVQVLSASDCSWILGEISIAWVYVIDFDNRVFTVNGGVHFRLENMPSRTSLIACLMRNQRSELPAKIVKTIDLWPPPRFDTAQAQQTYDQLRPLVMALPEWGVPTWDTLTVSQQLSASLVETLVEDYTDELALTQFSSVWHKVGLFCWQVANAAAPSHLSCPPLYTTPKTSSLYTRADLIKRPSSTHPSIHNYMGGKGTLGRYCWFRGCLITFCPRLDEPAYMMHQVGQMVENLRKHGRTNEIGIVMSGWHVVAVAVDGPEVRRSPVLDLHNGNELKDGFLLLTHLLAPAFTVSKAPWRNEPSVHRPNVSWLLPDEILQYIIHFTDSDTYSILPSLSHTSRSICLAQPRVGHHILLGYETTATSGPICKGPVFKTRSTDSTSSTLARLARIQKSIDNRLPLWRFRAKCYRDVCTLQPGLAGTFQHLQAGTGPLKCAALPFNRYDRERVFFRDMIRGDKLPEMRIQALGGLWVMVRVGEEENTRPNPDLQGWDSYAGINIAERMAGFDREDLEELSEVECEGWWDIFQW